MNVNNYIYGSSFYYHFDIRAKLLFTVLMSIVVFTIKSYVLSIAIALIAILLSLYSVKAKETLRGFRRLFPIIFFLFLFSPLYGREGRPLIVIKSSILLTNEGLIHALLSSSKFIAISYLFFLLMETERSENIVKGLRFYRLSYNAALTISLVLRYIPYLGSLYEEIRDSMSLRLKEKKRGYPIMPTITALTIASVKMAPELASALEERGFGRKERKDYRKLKVSPTLFIHLTIGATLPLLLLIMSK